MGNDPDVQKQIEKLLAEAQEKLAEAQKLAREHKESFYFCPDYGMGGTYDGLDGTWIPSSHNC